MTQKKLLAIFAHPDDESMGMGGTLAKYSAAGIETHLLCASRGERGWFGEPQHNPGLKQLGEIRTQELENASNVLGIKSLAFLDYIDGDVDKANHLEAIDKIVTHIRKIQPQVVITFPPDGGYGHPDHIAVGQFTSAAVVCAADATYKDAQNQSAYRVSKLYYMVDSENFVNLVSPFLGDMTFPVGDEIRSEFPWKEWMITTRIEMKEHCSTALKAIQCHQSQLATLGGLLEVEEEILVSALSLQGSFYRVFSLVNSGREKETDLFAGIS